MRHHSSLHDGVVVLSAAAGWEAKELNVAKEEDADAEHGDDAADLHTIQRVITYHTLHNYNIQRIDAADLHTIQRGGGGGWGSLV